MGGLLAYQHKLMSERAECFADCGDSLSAKRLEGRQALVVRKTHAGFDRASVKAISDVLAAIDRRELDGLRYLVFDFAHGASDAGAGDAQRPVEGFSEIIDATAELIVDTPVITLAWVRSLVNGLDFDFAMHCSAIVAEQGARFSFAGDPFGLLGLFAAVGRKVGFVKAERLIESDIVLSAEEARDLLIVKDVVGPQAGFAAIDDYLAQFGRRYNASHAIFRAQRMAQPPIDRRDLGAWSTAEAY